MEAIKVSDAITAIGALGTASFGLVDSTKAFGGGISRRGLGDIKKAIRPLFGTNLAPRGGSNPLTYQAILANLTANWMNGTDLADQKAIAKTLLKLRLDQATAATYAAETGMDPNQLAAIATKINTGVALSTPEADFFGRFDLALTALLDQAYQRADQRYRNSAKLLAGIIAIVIAIVVGRLLWDTPSASYWESSQPLMAALAGALATPLAPIAKDVTSAIAAGVNVLQKIRK